MPSAGFGDSSGREFGTLLRHARERARLTQQQLADRCGLSVKTINNLESGRVARPRIQSVQLLADELELSNSERSDFEQAALGQVGGPPPIPGFHPAPCLLPPDAPDFIGRAEQTSALIDTLTRPGAGDRRTTAPIFVLVGQGGVGKTALAVHVAHILREFFDDGQLFVDMRAEDGAPLAPSDVLARFLRACGVDSTQIPAGPAERTEMFRALTADKRMLVVLDNVVGESQVMPLIPSTASSALIVTSRTQLTSLWGSHTVRLPTLTNDAAFDLLSRMLGDRRITADPVAAQRIVRHCGRLPLALRIVGARLASRPSWPLARMADALSDERARLDELTVGDLSVRASLSLSYSDLREQQQLALRSLASINHDEFPAWIAAPLLNLSIDEAEALVDQLVNAQLLQTAGTDTTGSVRFRLHDLTRLFSREQAATRDTEGERRRALGRLTEAWLALVEMASAKLPVSSDVVSVGTAPRWPVPPALADKVQANAQLWLDVEINNIITAVETAAEADLGDVTWELAGCATSYLLLRNQYTLWDRVHEAALASSRRMGDLRGEAASLTALSWNPGRRVVPESVPPLQRALTIFEDLGDARGQAKTLVKLNETLRRLGRADDHTGSELARGAEYAESALRVLAEAPDSSLEADALMSLGTTQMFLRRFDEAAATLERALTLHRRLGARQDEAVVLWRFAQVTRGQGKMIESDAALKEAITLVEDLGDHHGQARLMLELGNRAMDNNDHQEAERWLEAAGAVDPRFLGDAIQVDIARARRALRLKQARH